MDSVQVGKAVFMKENYTTLGIEPRTYSYPGRLVNHPSVCWVKKNCGHSPLYPSKVGPPWLPTIRLRSGTLPQPFQFRVVRLELGGAEVEEIAGGNDEEEVKWFCIENVFSFSTYNILSCGHLYQISSMFWLFCSPQCSHACLADNMTFRCRPLKTWFFPIRDCRL